ncbi:MAG: hypothetical protein HY364_01665 [Candidatus Aenigmarchaeota archaeon]|nr:hypothetical protein [Candidatus Aenigmarchaeota archaeon]
MSKRNKVIICPLCNSKDISADFSNPLMAGFGHIFKECHHCGHRGMLFPEVSLAHVPKNPKNPAKLKGRTLVNMTMGRGYRLYLTMEIIIVLIVIAIILISYFNF